MEVCIYSLTVFLLNFYCKSIAIGIATDYGLDDQGVEVRVPVGSRMFTSPCHPERLCGPPSLLSSGYPGVKRQGRDAEHSPPSSAEVKKCGSIHPLPQYACMA
jgi:hypothetical protein